MKYSDDECEAVTGCVTNYHFVDDEEQPTCFSVLPIQWCDDRRPDTTEQKIFLHGNADSGLQKIYKHVTAWKVDLSCKQPEVSVLSKENNWIRLVKPRKSFEDTIRTILITLHCLHFLKKNPETSGKSLWDHLSNVFSLYKVRPSENDLRDHLSFISSAVKQDRTLATSKDTCTGFDAKEMKFIVDDDYEESDEDIGALNKKNKEETRAAKGDDSDTVCAICDNGGKVLCCDGECFRSFHATVAAAGVDSNCKSLGLSKAQLKAPNFFCPNCQYKQHQCFACGKLGSSDKSSGAEVFCCVSPTCGHFYHPKCAAELLHLGNGAEVKQLQKRIASGESFTCPAHKCFLCKQGENKDVCGLQFAICRRCPKAYHRKCLPREITFENSKDESIVPRAWDDLLPNRILIYCLQHEIEEGLGTPANHIVFPDVDSSVMQSSQEKVVEKKRMIAEDFRKSFFAKTPKQVGKVPSTKESKFPENKNKRFSVQGLDSTKRLSTSGCSKKLLKDSSEIHQSITTSNTEEMKKSSSTEQLVDAETKKRIAKLMRETASSISLKDVRRNYRSRSKHAYPKVLDKVVAQERVDGAVQAVRTALQRLEEGSNFEDSKDAFEPEILNRITELKVFPTFNPYFLKTQSATTNFEKTNCVRSNVQVVDKLHWYVRKGDTIVNLSCGANDFSCLMKQRLEETGKECSFKNYDVCRPKDDFNAKKSDWMSVNRKELPTGTKLVMGITLPVGVKLALVNKYVDKALEFKPKLLILFVPEGTERLDEKELRYELVWEDDEKLSGKSLSSFVNMNEKQIKQWNLRPPLLYLWSRGDWAAEHKAIALRKGHISKSQKNSSLEEENHKEIEILDDPRKEDHDHYIDTSNQTNDPPEPRSVAEEPDQTRSISLEAEHNTRIKQCSLDDDENSEGEEDDDEPFLVSKRSSRSARSQFNRKGVRRLLEDDPSEDLEATPSENVGRYMNKKCREAAKGSIKGLDSSSQSSSSAPNEETCCGKVGSLPSSPRGLLLSSAAEKQPVSCRTNMFDKSRSNTGSDANFLDFTPSPFRPCSHEQHSSCGWIDDE
ncbi:zinc finger protein [Macleaya cordata]|uniref:Zinc finger protein n=1 Tax=Macleaya cordata TaxID=56857 RepID=A0A200Q7X7_MACCD|nr:zinc finger protein [Macleaya cordata]